MRILPPNIHMHQHGSINPPPVIMLQPAYSVFPLIRAPLGYDLVYPLRTIALALLMALGAFVLTAISEPARAGAELFYGFLILSFAVSLVRFCKRAIGQRRGEEIHTEEAGYSVITRLLPFLPMPLSEQILTPAALSYLGWILAHAPLVYLGTYHGRTYYGPVSFMLGWWLFLAGLSYMLISRWEYRTRLAQSREPVNQMIQARIFQERLDAHERAARAQTTAGTGQTAPDYAEPDVAELGGKAKRRKNRAAPDITANVYPPDIAGYAQGSDSPAPDYVAWFRRGSQPSHGRE